MSAPLALEVEGIGKRYRIGASQAGYRTFRETVTDALASPWRRLRNAWGRTGEGDGERSGPDPIIWALKDISFDLERGKVLGVVGHNGAGKSTLLKVLSRITDPTEGQALLHGRVGSLLEVGTGFHGELTGRENTFLNGAILGMRRSETARKMDEIVAFAEVEQFLDTPVKHYSSGMYLRLAFAVAAHLEPEILLVDEVLAVGDAAFQKKCLGKMGEVARQGRTVLFVSHNMGAVNTLCDRALLLEGGRVALEGPTEEVTAQYLARQLSEEGQGSGPGVSVDRRSLEVKGAADGFRLTGVEVVNPAAPEVGPRTGDPLVVRIRYRAERQFVSPTFWMRLRTLFGTEVLRLSTRPISGFPIDELHGHGEAEVTIESLPVVASRYLLDLGMAREMMGWIARVDGAVELHVVGADVYGSGVLLDHTRGLVWTPHRWDHRPLEDRPPEERPQGDRPVEAREPAP